MVILIPSQKSYFLEITKSQNGTGMTSNGWIFKILDSSKGPKSPKGRNRFWAHNIESPGWNNVLKKSGWYRIKTVS